MECSGLRAGRTQIRIGVAGYEDRSLEFGKELWMKYQLPTDHYLYRGVALR